MPASAASFSVTQAVEEALDAAERTWIWLARHTSLTKDQLSRRRRGETEWTADDVDQVARALGITIAFPRDDQGVAAAP